MATMAGALVAYSVFERRINRHSLLLLQSQNAARAVLEYGTSQLAVQVLGIPRKELSASITTNPLTLYQNRASTLFPAATAGGQESNDYPAANTGTFSLYCSKPTTTGPFTFNSNDPRNATDPLNGQTVNTENIYLMASATANDVNGNSVTDYAMQAIQLRYASIFDFAIFYNVPMEFAPGAKMDIYGPVFSNADVYLNSAGGNPGNSDTYTLSFHSTFATAAKFCAQSLGVGEAGNTAPTHKNIFFPNKNNTAEVSILDPTINGNSLGTGEWVDSFLDQPNAPNQGNSPLDAASQYNFSKAASAIWGGNVQDGTTVQPESPPAIAAGAIAQLLTPAQATLELIQPPSPPTDTYYQQYIEYQKFSQEAGLYIVVTPNNDGTATGASVVAFYGTPGSNLQNAMSYLYEDLSKTPAVKNTAVERTAWLKLAANTPKVLFTSTGTTDNSVGCNTLAGIVDTTHLFYDPREKQDINCVDIDVGALALAIGDGSGNGGTYDKTSLTTTNNTGPLWTIDGAQGWNGVVYVDVETDTYDAYVFFTKARTGTPLSAATYYATPSTWGATGWKTTSSIGPTTATGTETAVRLVNGCNITGTANNLFTHAVLPSRPNSANDYSAGFSLASNAPIYVIGNYNTDGAMVNASNPSNEDVMSFDSTASPLPTGIDPISKATITIAQTSQINEVPAMVAGDAINILSNSWVDTSKPLKDATIHDDSFTNSDGSSNLANADVPVATNTEIAAGFITGNVPTVTTVATSDSIAAAAYNYCGGVENYLRLHEQWNQSPKVILRYRGSMVGLFNSAVATGPWQNTSVGTKTYSAPNRQWGYDNMFGIALDFPPGAPELVSVRRMNYTDINGATFNANKQSNSTYGFTLQTQ